MPSYATNDDLKLPAVAGMALGDRTAALEDASRFADGFLANRVTTPITTPSRDLVLAVCAIAAWNLLSDRGYNPEDPSAAAVRLKYEDAIKWLERVSKGSATPECLKTQAGSTGIGGPVVVQPQVTGTDASGLPLVTSGAPSARGW